MNLNISHLRQQAGARLQQAPYDPKKLVLIHTAVSLGASLAITLVGFLINLKIEDTGGLGGMGVRSVLETAQAMLELAVMVLLPFWNIGIIRAALCWGRNERAYPADLAEGFRRFGSVLGEKCLLSGLFLLIAFLASQMGSILYTLTPFSRPLLELTLQLSTAKDPAALMTEEFAARLFQEMIPALVISGVLFVIFSVPMFYRVRFADYALIGGARAFESIIISFKITHLKRWQLFKLDLSFWWFYLLQLLSVALCYGDAILAAFGVYLPISEDLSLLLFYLLGTLAQGALLWQYQAKVSATYGVVYDTLNPREEPKAEN